MSALKPAIRKQGRALMSSLQSTSTCPKSWWEVFKCGGLVTSLIEEELRERKELRPRKNKGLSPSQSSPKTDKATRRPLWIQRQASNSTSSCAKHHAMRAQISYAFFFIDLKLHQGVYVFCGLPRTFLRKELFNCLRNRSVDRTCVSFRSNMVALDAENSRTI
jgi:hypothetical protein